LLAKGLGLQNSIELESIGCRLTLAEIYENVEFPASVAEARA
jgi:hypothetical protein